MVSNILNNLTTPTIFLYCDWASSVSGCDLSCIGHVVGGNNTRGGPGHDLADQSSEIQGVLEIITLENNVLPNPSLIFESLWFVWIEFFSAVYFCHLVWIFQAIHWGWIGFSCLVGSDSLASMVLVSVDASLVYSYLILVSHSCKSGSSFFISWSLFLFNRPEYFNPVTESFSEFWRHYLINRTETFME